MMELEKKFQVSFFDEVIKIEYFENLISLIFVYFQKMVLIRLIYGYFWDTLKIQLYPNHVISVTKQNILNVKEIEFPHLTRVVKLHCSSIFSKLERLSKLR